MKAKLIFLAMTIVVACYGCGSSQSSATQAEEDHFRHPSKFPPKEAVPGGPPKAKSN